VDEQRDRKRGDHDRQQDERPGQELETTRRRVAAAVDSVGVLSVEAYDWGVLPLARALVVVVLALALVSAAAANPQRSVARFCGSTDGAQWVAKRQDPGAPFAGTLFGDSYRVWRRSVDCGWAFHKVAFLTHGLGTKYMNLANLGDFKWRTRRPPAREHILSLKPRAARGECWNTRPKSVARFEWRPTFPPP
jgi:hypothetical protein